MRREGGIGDTIYNIDSHVKPYTQIFMNSPNVVSIRAAIKIGHLVICGEHKNDEAK